MEWNRIPASILLVAGCCGFRDEWSDRTLGLSLAVSQYNPLCSPLSLRIFCANYLPPTIVSFAGVLRLSRGEIFQDPYREQFVPADSPEE